ncbi:MAG TPA: transcription-repair coupling factor [Thermoanaerobaculia bacterium]|nr:transcription-repair coupling factor [Thermoanaerobaculia bacterium]
MAETRNDSLIADLRQSLASSEVMTTLVERAGSGAVEVTGSSLEARALILAALQERIGRKLVIIVPGDTALHDLEQALRLFHHDPVRLATYPAPSLSPYQDVPSPLAVIREEIRTVGMLATGEIELLVIPARALYRRLPEPADFSSRLIDFSAGAELDVRGVLQRLVENGYVRTDLVGEVGEFAFRGGILDVFPPNAEQPLRVELFGDTIESLRYFEVETQRSAEVVSRVSTQPAALFPLTPALRAKLARRLSTDFNGLHYKRDLAEKIERLSEHDSFPGIENFLPVAADGVSFETYLETDEWTIAVVEPDEVLTSIEKYETLLRSEYDATAGKGKAVYAPDQLLVPAASIHAFLDSARITLSSLHLQNVSGGTGSGASRWTSLKVHTPVAESYVNRLSDLGQTLEKRRQEGQRQIVFASTKGGREKIERILREFSIPFEDEPPAIGRDVAVTHGNLAQGFDFDEIGVSIVSEWDLFEQLSTSRITPRRKRSTEAFQTDLRDLKAGDFIVHVDHGVGRFLGLRRIPFGETEREVMELEYSAQGKLLLPMENLNLIQKYSGGGDSQPKLDRLGGTAWARTKASVKKAMRDMADELIRLYATRQMVQGFAFTRDTPWQFEFEESFEFDETEDQISAIDDLKHDMESRKPMDRLLCGDVGYGKTEVAMRAAFKAVMDGKQVAVLAPTTILAYQHYRTFMRRFASFPVTIELISRFRSPKEQKAILERVERGEVDILIGTHRILSKGESFKDLGLLVIDEEQRFGVAQKERLKQFKKAIDVLSMSATPIPRTLHMSLAGIRDISVIETPPKDRLAIQTAVVPFDDQFVREAIEFEIGRGGQIFFVHNRVESIYQIKEYLENLVPGLRVVVGHGQMDEKELERSMLAFIDRQYDLLLATTIIENGIDIPAANTILIHHSERFGLSQLYQLRGRVGRSDRLAFCYLLVPSSRGLSGDARKRLAAIQEFSDLGAGFRIAARDLDIRGSGNILGGEQSGQIAAVGFEMYTKLLEEAVRELKGEKVDEEVETSMNLGLDIYIPPDYITDENLRMVFYKKLASARDEDRLEAVRNEMRDRFGAIPATVESLLAFIRLKQFAQSLGVVSIVRQAHTAVIKFHPSARIDPNRLLQFMSETPTAKFSPGGNLSIQIPERGHGSIAVLMTLLEGIAG